MTIIGLGNEYRCDDGLGPAVLKKLKTTFPDRFTCIHHSGDPAGLIDLWRGRNVCIVDALNVKDRVPGQVLVFDPFDDMIEPEKSITSSHVLSLSEAIELGKVMNKRPLMLIVVGVIGKNFFHGNSLSKPVADAVDKVIASIIDLSIGVHSQTIKRRTSHA